MGPVKILLLQSVLHQLFTGFPKPPLSPLIVDNSLVEMSFPKIRPVGGREVEFGVGNLPKQEIADPGFSAGADEELRVRYTFGAEVMP